MKRMTPAARRYMLRVAIAMAIYLVSLFTAEYLIERVGVSRPLAFALALIPGVAVAGLFYAIGMFIVETKDEFMRMLLVRQQLIAAGFALSVACVWGFLEQYALVEHVKAFWIVVVWTFGQFVGMVSNRITHGSWGESW
jgi:hypothetical protein